MYNPAGAVMSGKGMAGGTVRSGCCGAKRKGERSRSEGIKKSGPPLPKAG